MAVTIHDVARGADVSVSTVSRAFTMPDMVNAATRRKVLQVAEELGYQPNRAARGLVTGKTGNIGVVVPDVANPFFSAMLKGCTARAREVRHVVFLADAAEDPRVEAEVVGAMAKQVDGVVLCSPRMQPSQLERLVGSTPLVLVNRDEAGLPAVLMDSADGARQALEHLAALGHRRVAHLAGPFELSTGVHRHDGFVAGMRGAGLAVDEDLIVAGNFYTEAEGARLLRELLARGAEFTAVLAGNDLLALGCIDALREAGLDCPRDVSVVGFNDMDWSARFSPPLTTVRVPHHRLGIAAADLLLERLADAGAAVRHVVLPVELVVRGSTAPPAAAAT
jgi:DNA-binding LacI/PurR family transcriptional regulator